MKPCQHIYPLTGGACGQSSEHHGENTHNFEWRNRRIVDRRAAPAPLDGLREALLATIVDLPQPTLGRAGGVNRGAVIDAINREFAALRGTSDTEGEGYTVETITGTSTPRLP